MYELRWVCTSIIRAICYVVTVIGFINIDHWTNLFLKLGAYLLARFSLKANNVCHISTALAFLRTVFSSNTQPIASNVIQMSWSYSGKLWLGRIDFPLLSLTFQPRAMSGLPFLSWSTLQLSYNVWCHQIYSQRCKPFAVNSKERTQLL